MRAPRQLALVLVAVQFLTRLPVPSPAGFEPDWLSRSARYFPLVGALVGAINVTVWWLSTHWFPNSLAIGLMMATSLLVTGAFHEDGFADTCDGLGGGETPERVLAIMKDSRVGAYGAIGIVTMLGLKWSTLASLPVGSIPLLVVGAHMLSRWCTNGLIWSLSYVRSEDGGKSKPLADSLSGSEWILSGVFGVLALTPLLLVGGASNLAWLYPAVIAGVISATVISGIAALYFKQRIGGYTGDCLGATQQLAEIAFLLAALAALVPAASPA